MRKIYTKTFVYFAEIQYIYNEINNRNIIMDILNFTYYFLIYNLIFHYCPVKAGKSVFEIVET